VMSVMLVSLLLISSIGLVSAGLKDWFGFGDENVNLEGELADSFNIGITMNNQAPTITSWVAPSGNPTPCTTTALGAFVVSVTDPDGDSDLADGGIVKAYFYRGAILRPVTGHLGAVTCVAGTPNGDNVLEFTCPSITMNYWDLGGTSNPWTINITATDGTSRATNNANLGYQISLGVAHATYPHFVYGTAVSPQIKDDNDVDYTTSGAGTDTLAWGSIVTSSADVAADRYLVTRNCGNIAIATTSITGTELESATTTTNIEPDSFSVRAANPLVCNNGQTIPKSTALSVTSGTVPVSTGTETTNSFYFCLEDINPDGDPDPIQVGTYATATPWTIAFS